MKKYFKTLTLIMTLTSLILVNINTTEAATNFNGIQINFISPSSGSILATPQVNVQFTLKNNSASVWNGTVLMYVANQTDTTNLDNNHFEYETKNAIPVTLSPGETKNLTMSNIPLYYDNDNFIYPLLQTSGGMVLSNSYLQVKRNGNLTPLYRFLSLKFGNHFFTSNPTEKGTVAYNTPTHIRYYESIGFNVLMLNGDQTCRSNGKQVYRFWNARTSSHFYTISVTEKDFILNNLGGDWAFDGPVFCALETQDSGSLPVYRFYNARFNSHLFTIKESEKNFVQNNLSDWRFEGTAYYAFPWVL